MRLFKKELTLFDGLKETAMLNDFKTAEFFFLKHYCEYGKQTK